MKSIITMLFASVALAACGKKEEAPVVTPAPVVTAPSPAPSAVDAATKQDAQNVPTAAEPAKKEEAKK